MKESIRANTKPIPLWEYEYKYPEPYIKSVLRHAVTGGVPQYVDLFHKYDDFYTAMHEQVLSKDGSLYGEAIRVLREKVTDVDGCLTILHALSTGIQTQKGLEKEAKIPPERTKKLLHELEQTEIIVREKPIAMATADASKLERFAIQNAFLGFWVRFVYPRLECVESGRAEEVLAEIRREFPGDFLRLAYRNICRDRVKKPDERSPWRFPVDRCGGWWDGHAEIDIVATGGEKNILFGACSIGPEPMTVEDFWMLKERARRVDWHRNDRREHYVLYSLGGYTDDLWALPRSRSDLFLQV